MSNWCESELTVSSNNEDQLRQFVQHMSATKRGSELSLRKLLPIPEELYAAPDGEDGMPAVVEWAINNRGCWQEFRAEATWISDSCIKYVYVTKCWPAVEWIKYSAQLYPDLEFRLVYDCYEASYYGTFKAHGIIHSNEFFRTEPFEAICNTEAKI